MLYNIYTQLNQWWEYYTMHYGHFPVHLVIFAYCCTVQCTVYCIIYTVIWALYNEHCILYTVHCTPNTPAGLTEYSAIYWLAVKTPWTLRFVDYCRSKSCEIMGEYHIVKNYSGLKIHWVIMRKHKLTFFSEKICLYWGES